MKNSPKRTLKTFLAQAAVFATVNAYYAVEGLPIDLCLAGHTHGGQVQQVPFFGALVTLSQLPNHSAAGFHDLGHTRLNVSVGVGFEHSYEVPAIRVNCPPEMSMIELVPELPNEQA